MEKKELEASIALYDKWIDQLEKDLESRLQKNKEWAKNTVITSDTGTITIKGSMSGSIVGNNIKNATVIGSKPYSDSDISVITRTIERYKNERAKEQQQLDQMQ
jgi:hypothetical protein